MTSSRAAVAQWREQRPRNAQVAGSTPARRAIVMGLLVLCCCQGLGGGLCCAEQAACLGLVQGCLCVPGCSGVQGP